MIATIDWSALILLIVGAAAVAGALSYGVIVAGRTGRREEIGPRTAHPTPVAEAERERQPAGIR
ncbi:hypothetical protein [Sphaerisporangium fuscum]|uniref:hypothetical protein n=1 Tax=Sphaerisporangium fuscum TaxID=2835868 RepID=UPI001BDBE8B9|nr:hypothetical protein [Sphaerisporangium fuscum]